MPGTGERGLTLRESPHARRTAETSSLIRHTNPEVAARISILRMNTRGSGMSGDLPSQIPSGRAGICTGGLWGGKEV